MNTFQRRGLGFAAALGILALIALPKFIEMRRDSAPASNPGSKAVLRVKVHQCHADPLTEQLATTGTVRANEEVEIVSEVSGKISVHLTSRRAAGWSAGTCS